MQIRQIPLRDTAEAERAPWGDERQVAVWGQVSARTLYLVVALNVVAGFIFNTIDSSRYGPCVTVFYGIALGSTAYAGWTAYRKGVDVRAPRITSRARLVAGSLVFGVFLYVAGRFSGGDPNHDSWTTAALTITGYALGFGFGMRFLAAWRQRQALREQEAPDDDTSGAPDPML